MELKKRAIDLRNWDDFNQEQVLTRCNRLLELDIDFDVFLKTRGINLQRDLVWTLDQKQKLIESMLIGRYVPPAYLIGYYKDRKENDKSDDESYLCIDGKQRLNAMIDFMKNKFHIVLEGNDFYYDDLPEDYKQYINRYNVNAKLIWDYSDGDKFSDDYKIKLFERINYFGTPQDDNHIKKLKGC